MQDTSQEAQKALPTPRRPSHGRGYAYTPAPGRAWNPLKDWPRNGLCFCGEPKKAKKCCLDKIEQTVELEKYADLRTLVDRAIELHDER